MFKIIPLFITIYYHLTCGSKWMISQYCHFLYLCNPERCWGRPCVLYINLKANTIANKIKHFCTIYKLNERTFKKCIPWERTHKRNVHDPIFQNVGLVVAKLLTKNHDDPTVQSPGNGSFLQMGFEKRKWRCSPISLSSLCSLSFSQNMATDLLKKKIHKHTNK